MKITSFKIDSYSVHIYARDRKGRRTRWGDKMIRLFSEGREVAQAVFAREGFEAPEPYFSGGKIYFFAQSEVYPSVINLLQSDKTVYIAWKPVPDPKEASDGDAYFYTEAKK
jgi:hypothetical protein